MSTIDAVAKLIDDWARCGLIVATAETSRGIANDLNKAGLLAPDLPEPNDPDIFVTQGKGWLPGGAYGPSVWTAPGSMVMVQRVEPGDLTPEEARALAYAILAAADYAEVVPDGT